MPKTTIISLLFLSHLLIAQSKGDKIRLDSLTKAYQNTNNTPTEKWQKTSDLALFYRNKRKSDKAIALYKEALQIAKEDGQKIESYQKIAKTYSFLSNYEKCATVVEEGIGYAQNIKNDSIRLYALHYLISEYPLIERKELRNKYLEMSQNFYIDAKNHKKYRNLLISIYDLYHYYSLTSDIKPLVDTINIAISFYAQSNEFDGMLECYDVLVGAYLSQKNYQELAKSLFRYESKIELYKNKITIEELKTNYFNVSGIYKSLGLFGKALFFMDKYEKLLEKETSRMTFNCLKGDIYYAMGKRETVKYYRLAEEEAINKKDADRLRRICPLLLVDYVEKGQKSRIDSFFSSIKHINISDYYRAYIGEFANYYIKLNQLDKAKSILQFGIAVNIAYNYNYDIRDIYKLLYQVNLKQKNYKEAVHFLQEYNNVKDSMNVRETMFLLTENEYKQETEKQQYEQQQQVAKLDADKKVQLYLGGLGLLFLSIFSFVFYKRYQEKANTNRTLSEANERSEALLLNILPVDIAEELKKNGKSEAQEIIQSTVLFTDIQNFTQKCENLSASVIVAELDYCFSAFDNIIAKYPIEKIKTVGDAYICAGGLPIKNDTHAFDIVAAALEMQAFLQTYKNERELNNLPFFEMRMGIHTGSLVAGIVGVKKFQYDIWGDTVNTAARMEAASEVGKVNISETTYNIIQANFNTSYRGKIEAKNKGAIDMYFVESKVVVS